MCSTGSADSEHAVDGQLQPPAPTAPVASHLLKRSSAAPQVPALLATRCAAMVAQFSAIWRVNHRSNTVRMRTEDVALPSTMSTGDKIANCAHALTGLMLRTPLRKRKADWQKAWLV